MACIASTSLQLLFVLTLCNIFLFASPATIKLPLTRKHQHQHSNNIERMKHLTSQALSRAQDLKHPSMTTRKSRLYSRSYGEYVITLKVGTPPQAVNLDFDTGSSAVWFPCTSGYKCINCSSPDAGSKAILKFLPEKSSTAKLIKCKDPRCEWIQLDRYSVLCKNATSSTDCPPYILVYGTGSSQGFLFSETLDLSKKDKVTDFLVGCSTITIDQTPGGTLGFGRTPDSLPSQMKVKKFSYCLVSRKYDDTKVYSDVILYTGRGKSSAIDTEDWTEQDRNNSTLSSMRRVQPMSYTPFVKNPTRSVYDTYYYVEISHFIIGGKTVNVPRKYLVPGPDGNGGTIVDSGSTITSMDKPIHDLVTNEFTKQMTQKHFKLAPKEMTGDSGFNACFVISSEKEKAYSMLPDFVIQYNGGARMVLPKENYFDVSLDKPTGKYYGCLVVGMGAVGETVGPSIILGAFQQQNFYLEFDLVNNIFGFKPQKCA